MINYQMPVQKRYSIFTLFSVLYLLGIILAQSKFGPIFIVGISFLLSFFLFISKNAFLTKSYLAYYILFLFFILFASKGNLTESVIYILGFFLNVIIYEFYARRVLNKKHILILVWSIILLSTGIFLLSNNIELFFSNRNSVPLLLIFIFYLSDLYLNNNKTTRFVVVFFVLFFTFINESRGGLLLIISYMVLRFIKSKKIQVLIFLSVIIILSMFYLFHIFTVFDFQIMGRSINYLSHRNELWELSFDLIKKNPFGMGYNGYADTFKEILDVNKTAHNTYLNILLQFGWFFLMAYFIFLIKLIKDTRNHITLACVFAMHIRGFFESGTPFAFSLASALLILPFYLERPIHINIEDNKK